MSKNNIVAQFINFIYSLLFFVNNLSFDHKISTLLISLHKAQKIELNRCYIFNIILQ